MKVDGKRGNRLKGTLGNAIHQCFAALGTTSGSSLTSLILLAIGLSLLKRELFRWKGQLIERCRYLSHIVDTERGEVMRLKLKRI
jgi:hypothetical protein